MSQRTLTAQLRQLQADGIISRTVLPAVPPHVEYRLTAHGQSLRAVILALHAWGARHQALGRGLD